MFGNKIGKIQKLAEKKNGAKIASFLNDRNPDVVFAAIEGLGIANGEDAINALISLLRHPDAKIRMATAKAMERTGNPRVKAHLDAQLRSEQDAGVAAAIRSALAHVRSDL